MKKWKDMNWRQHKKKRKEKIAQLVKAMGTCENKTRCLINDLQYVMMAIRYPADCPKDAPEPLEMLAAVVTMWGDEKDLTFLLKFLPDLNEVKRAAEDAEKQLAVLESGKSNVPEEIKGQKHKKAHKY